MLKIDYTRQVQYELMHGKEATKGPVGYLPIGCLERHGDHLPMGLDAMKAHGVCCLAAKAIGGVVFPAHHFAGIHLMNEEQIARSTGQWGNVYTDRSAEGHLVDIINQFGIAGIQVLVLYSGHYPVCQVEMIESIAKHFECHKTVTVIPFAERMIMDGDHAGSSETSFMLYLDKQHVDMTAIGEENYKDHGWKGPKSPELASVTQGEESIGKVVDYLRGAVEEARKVQD
jgi:creatinine amidohydrolase/Fe(II)-dependent formamide hydrolase-like protein